MTKLGKQQPHDTIQIKQTSTEILLELVVGYLFYILFLYHI